jgi:autotransporter passenger strand-loop-strand repeat protein
MPGVVTVADTQVDADGFILVNSGGTSIDTVVSSGGTEEVDFGGVASGTTVNSGGFELVVGGVATGTTLLNGGTIDVITLPYVSGSATVDPTTDVLTVSEGGQTYTQQLSGDYTGDSFRLTSDNGNGGTDIQLAAALFTSGADNVDFNSLTPAQLDAVNAGAELYNSLDGDDTVVLPDPANYQLTPTVAWDPTQTFTMGDGNDMLTGGDGNYIVSLGSGNDTVTLGNGNDMVTVGGGTDTITVGSGTDTIVGGAGLDSITLGSGTDIVYGSPGNDIISGGAGQDTFDYVSSAGAFPNFENFGDDTTQVINGGHTVFATNPSQQNVIVLPGSADDYTFTLLFDSDTLTGTFTSIQTTSDSGFPTVYINTEDVEAVEFAETPINDVVLTGLSPGGFSGAPVGVPIPGDVASEMTQLSYEVYNPTYKFAGLLLSTAEPLAYDSAAVPGETAIAQNTNDWDAVSAMELGMAPADFGQGTLDYSFVNGFYQATSLIGGIVPDEADAMVLLGEVDDKTTLAIDFRGTDQASDFSTYFNFISYYQEFAPLVTAIEGYLQNVSNDIEQVIVAGHSLGAAAMQYLVGALEAQQPQDPTVQDIQGYSDGSPGSESPAQNLPIENFVQIGDPIPLASHIAGTPAYISSQLHALLNYFGISGYLAASFLSSAIQPKTVAGSDIYIDDNPDGGQIYADYQGTLNISASLATQAVNGELSTAYHSSDLYAENVETLYEFASDPASPFYYSQVGESLLNNTLYTGPNTPSQNPYAPGAVDGNVIAVSAIFNTSNPVPFLDVYVHPADNYVLGGSLFSIFWDLPTPGETVHVVDGGPAETATVTLLGSSSQYDLVPTQTPIGPDVQVYYFPDGVPSVVNLSQGQLIGDVYRVPLSNFQFTGGYVDNVSTSQTGDVAAGQTVQLTLTMNGPVSVDTSGGSRTLTLGDPVTATYDATASNPAAGTLVFDYTPGAGEQTANLQFDGVNLNGSVITGVSGAAVDFSAATGDTGLSVNSPLTVISVASSQTGEIGTGQTIQLNLTMTEAFVVNAPDGGSVTLALNDGALATYDATLSNPAMGLMVFDYTVQAGDQTRNLSVSGVSVPSGVTVQDGNGYNADFSQAIGIGTGVQVGAPTAPVIGGGGNTVFWTEGNPPTVIAPGLTVGDAGSTTLTGATATISSGFLNGDQLDFTNQNGITGNYDATTGLLSLSGTVSVANYQTALDSVSYSSTSSSPSAAGADSVRTITWQASDSAGTSNTVSSTIDVGEIDNLTTGPDTIEGGVGNDIIIATNNTLSTGDQIDGGGGTNTLELVGAGTFNMAVPATLADIQTITAQEGQAAYAAGGTTYPAQNQIVTLRNGLNATVDVSADAAVDPGNPKAPTITIIGAQNAAVINLAAGNDTVQAGDPRETVNLGTGNDTILVTSATIGATIGNGTGTNTLEVTGGGTMAMGGSIGDIATVLLASAATPYNFTANAISSLTVDDLDTGADTVQAGGADQTLTGGGVGKLEMVGSSAGNDTFKNASTLFNGHSIQGFGPNGDVIDLTNVSPTSVGLSFTENAAMTGGTLNVTAGTHSAAITLFGQFVAAGFHTATDSGGLGTAITYQTPVVTAALATPLHPA